MASDEGRAPRWWLCTGTGIDVEPPPGDLAEPADEDVVGVAPPEMADVPDVVNDGVA